MNLSPLLPLIRTLLPAFEADDSARILGVPDGAKAAAVAALTADRQQPVLLVTARADRAARFAEELADWLGDPAAVAVFPELDLIPYQHVAPDTRSSELRLEILQRLGAESAPRLIVTCGLALAQTTIDPSALSASVENLQPGRRLPLNSFLERLRELGYEFVSLVEQPGQASRRGGIIDVYSPNAEHPLRIELFGDEIDSLRFFDPATQRAVEAVTEAKVGPAQEALVPAARVAELRSALDISGMQPDQALLMEEELERVAAGDVTAGGGFWLPFLTPATLLDHLKPGVTIVIDEPFELQQALAELDAQAEDVREALVRSGQIPAHLPLPFLNQANLMSALDQHSPLALQRWATEESAGAALLPFGPAGAFAGRLRNLTQEIVARLQAGWRVVLVSQQGARLGQLLQAEGIDASAPLSSRPSAGALSLITGSLPHGWSLHAHGVELLLLTDNEIFGFVKQRRTMHPARRGREAFLSDLTPGDFVVHIEHGIARFAGLISRQVDGVEREYLELRYGEGDRLFVPSDQIDRVSRYIGPGEHTPSLTRLGTQEWTRAKDRVRRAVTDLAQELLQVYAAREALPGHAFPADTPWQQEMEATFPYVETPDQLRGLHEIKGDMEAARPMDRVVVGDVGYGKT
ncbi:MAG: CarD family transcriptional regulator, partial [Dehalococcoidia bacterium]